MPRRWRFLLLAVGAALAVVLFLVLRAEDEAPVATPPPPPATGTATQAPPPATGTATQPPPPATGTAPQPPPPSTPRLIYLRTNTDAVTRRSIRRGSRVLLVITGDPGEEVHLHGYDVKRTVRRDGTAAIPFRATIPGRFEVELEESHRQIADLTVR